jgi:hypothetical protein
MFNLKCYILISVMILLLEIAPTFDLGAILVIEGACECAEKYDVSFVALVVRHACEDWGTFLNLIKSSTTWHSGTDPGL